MTGPYSGGPLVRGDIHSSEDLERAFKTHMPSAVIHLASSINVRESIENPDLYYHNNLVGCLSLARAMVKHRVLNLVFSSSAAVYGSAVTTPITEEHPKAPLNPYGKTKSMAEDLFEDFFAAYGLSVLSLRYFNAAGADVESEVGEAHEPETHLIPRLIETAMGRRREMTIYGNTGVVRDYVHVDDLARAHCLGMGVAKLQSQRLYHEPWQRERVHYPRGDRRCRVQKWQNNTLNPFKSQFL